MALSDEDRKRIHAEEEEREKAKQKVQQKNTAKGCLASLVVLILIASGCVAILASGGDGDVQADPVTQDQLQAALDEISDALRDANAAAEMQLFENAAVKESGRRLEVTVSDIWYQLAEFEKERLVNTLADRYALTSASHGLRGEAPDSGNYPTTSFVDSFGTEVAYKSTFRTEILR